VVARNDNTGSTGELQPEIEMLSAIKDIGMLSTKKEYLLQKQIEGKVFVILLNTDEQKYSEIDIEDFDTEKISQYLFKESSSKGRVPSPFCPLTEPHKSYKKVSGWIKKCTELKDSFAKEDTELLNKILSVLNKKRKEIIEKIDQKFKDLSKKERKFLAVKINGKYLGEYDIFKECINKFAEEKRKRSVNEGVCSICGTSNKEVSGKTDVFRFYSIDKPGFITGGFQESNAWKNYPVCKECEKFLENGRKFIDIHLNFKFYGLNYYLIPKLFVGDNNLLEDIITVLSDTTKTVRLKERIKKRITNDENEILEYLSEKKDVLTLNFLFLQRRQSAEKILLLIEDVFPSRIGKIFESKNYVDKIFNNLPDGSFTFAAIRTFFSKSDNSKRTNDLNKYFLEIIDKTFKGGKLDFSFLAKFYMMSIRKAFTEKDPFHYKVKDALMSTMFFENLGLISFEEVKNMEESVFSDIFTHYGKSLSTPAQRGIFLLGTLTQLLLNKQWNDRGAKPFMKKLKGLKMEERNIKTLLAEVQNKLEEYESFDKGKRKIASEVSRYLLEAGDGWKMSIDEMNFYFACGMNLVDSIANIVYPKIKEE
jgi:CRISPR-associated protein Csh1